jgi:drug/metabolite transporter (DMT)-like permease
VRFHRTLTKVLGMALVLTRQTLQEGQAGIVAIFSSVSPIVILPLLWLIYRRRPAAGAWIGAALAITGTALILGHT